MKAAWPSNTQPDAPLVDRTWIGLQGSGQQSVGRVAGEGEEQMPDVLDRNAVLEQRVVDRIGQRQVVQLEETEPR